MKPTTTDLLHQLNRPAFTVRKQKIIEINEEAAHLQLEPGMNICQLLRTTPANYDAFECGTLFLPLEIHGQLLGATVTRYANCDLFVLNEEAPDRLQAMALSAKTLRSTFSEMLLLAERAKQSGNLTPRELQSYERSAMRMQRQLSNMADAIQFVRGQGAHLRDTNLKGLFDELFERTAALVEQPKIVFHGLSEPLIAAVDAAMLDRAAYNLISNAVKFTPANGQVEMRLVKLDTQLQLIIQDNGEGIADHIWGSLFTRYHRSAGIEDCRYGMGLGLLLTSCIAAMHGGALLVQKAPGGGTRVAMTISLLTQPSQQLYDHAFGVDRTGGKSIALCELSDVLPNKFYG